VREIVILCCQETLRERFAEFEFQGYRRDLTRERPESPQFVLVKRPARGWIVKGGVKANGSE